MSTFQPSSVVDPVLLGKAGGIDVDNGVVALDENDKQVAVCAYGQPADDAQKLYMNRSADDVTGDKVEFVDIYLEKVPANIKRLVMYGQRCVSSLEAA